MSKYCSKANLTLTLLFMAGIAIIGATPGCRTESRGAASARMQCNRQRVDDFYRERIDAAYKRSASSANPSAFNDYPSEADLIGFIGEPELLVDGSKLTWRSDIVDRVPTSGLSVGLKGREKVMFWQTDTGRWQGFQIDEDGKIRFGIQKAETRVR